jgi:hypothetical protein
MLNVSVELESAHTKKKKKDEGGELENVKERKATE